MQIPENKANDELPEYIQGLATRKSASKQRRKIVEKEYAILHLETIVKKAGAKIGEPIYIKPKETGKQKEHNYANMAVLYYKFEDIDKWYLNFTVKLILGIKNDGTHIQYSVNKITAIE